MTRVLDRLIDRMAAIMATTYADLGITDAVVVDRLRKSLGQAFIERFDELTLQVERGGLA